MTALPNFCPLTRDWTLQTFIHDHGGATGAAVGNLEPASGGLSLTLRSESTCLMAHRALAMKLFYRARRARKLCGLLSP